MTTSATITEEPTRPEDSVEYVIATTALTKRYRSGVLAVDAVDLRVRPGEVYGFLGPNGAGKTTTMRMLLGLIRPTSGGVLVLGQPPGSPAGLSKVGSLVESPGFYPYLSGRDNLRVLARYAGVDRPAIETVLEVTDLSGRAGDKFARYSLGMKQRLGVAAALLKDPELLILDEPTNGLDPAGMADMRGLIRRLGEEGRTVLLSSHQLGEVEQICDRVGVIDGGQLIAESTVGELRGSADLIVGVDRADLAARIATDLLGPDAVRVADGTLRCKLEPGQVGCLNRALVRAGVDVTELRLEERSLEEVFLSMTTKGSDNAG
ncbi:MAG: ABC transporter ATP-binding protein [Marmoricola sp.]